MKMVEIQGEWDHDFTPGRGTMEIIFTFKIILEKSWSGKNIYILGSHCQNTKSMYLLGM